jgi:purine-binding chemotaxis protein CheW
VRYALKLGSVARVLRAAAVTPLPHAPDVVLGVLDLHGDVIPVISLRKRFGLAVRSIRSDDLLVVARTATRTVALAVDSTEGVVEEESVVSPDEIVAGTSFLAGVTRTAEGLVLIHDLETVLFPDEEQLLAQALEQAQ